MSALKPPIVLQSSESSSEQKRVSDFSAVTPVRRERRYQCLGTAGRVRAAGRAAISVMLRGECEAGTTSLCHHDPLPSYYPSSGGGGTDTDSAYSR